MLPPPEIVFNFRILRSKIDCYCLRQCDFVPKSLTTDSGLNLSARYTYTNDLLTSIQTPSTTYNFEYGNFGLRNSVKVGTQELAGYSYENGTNRLEELDYGNGDKVQYTYDNRGRVTQQTYEDGAYVTYKYDNSGALAKVYDSETGTTSTYYYDFTDRLMKYRTGRFSVLAAKDAELSPVLNIYDVGINIADFMLKW